MATKILEVTDVNVIKAAGGVVCRSNGSGKTEVVVVHRPAYDDWTLPKGKIDPEETPEECALREVREETGYKCELVRPLGCTAYVDRRGRTGPADIAAMAAAEIAPITAAKRRTTPTPRNVFRSASMLTPIANRCDSHVAGTLPRAVHASSTSGRPRGDGWGGRDPPRPWLPRGRPFEGFSPASRSW